MQPLNNIYICVTITTSLVKQEPHIQLMTILPQALSSNFRTFGIFAFCRSITNIYVIQYHCMYGYLQCMKPLTLIMDHRQ